MRYGARMLLKKPGFTIVAVFTLALGIGANSAIFSVLNAVFWARLPYKDPERLVIVWETIPKTGQTENTPAPFNYYAWREQSRVFENLAAWQILLENLTGAGEPEQIPGQGVSASFFPLLGVEPMLGRLFSPEDDRRGNHLVVVLNHSLWLRRFGGDPNIIGRKIALSNENYEVIGVMPPSLRIRLRLLVTPRNSGFRSRTRPKARATNRVPCSSSEGSRPECPPLRRKSK
jgi:putative ABC transport system permease protein